MSFFRGLGGLLRFDRANWKAIVLCILAASIFWLFNAFNKNHAANIEFPLQFEYDNEKYVPVEALPKQVAINVSGNGWDLFRNQLGIKLPALIIPLERPLETKKLVSASLTTLVQPQLKKLSINFFVVDTLRLRIDERDFHKFKVIPDFTEFTFKKGFGRISPLVVLPDSVRLQGPKAALHQLPDFVSVKITSEGVNDNVSQEVKIATPGEFIQSAPNSVKVMFEVGEVTDVVAMLKLSTKMKTTPTDSIHAWFRIPVKREEEFKSLLSEISGIVSVQKPDEFGMVKPILRNVPAYAEVIAMDTVRLKTLPK